MPCAALWESDEEDAVDDPYRGTKFNEFSKKIRNVVGTSLLLGVGRGAERGLSRFRDRKQRLRWTKLHPRHSHTAAGNCNSASFYGNATRLHCDAARWYGNPANDSANSRRRVRLPGEYFKSGARNRAGSELHDQSDPG